MTLSDFILPGKGRLTASLERADDLSKVLHSFLNTFHILGCMCMLLMLELLVHFVPDLAS